MAKQTVETLVQGGKASAAPPLGPALGPLGVNIGEVVNKINEKTASFAGMQVPVRVVVDDETKEFSISVGTPPASALIKKEAGIEKGSGNPVAEKVADLKMEQIIKIAKMKEDNLLGKDMVQKVKEIIGTCNSMGVLVEGKPAVQTIADINTGTHVEKIKAGKTELSDEELKQLEEEKQKLQEEIEKHHEEFLKKAKEIVAQMAGEENRAIRKALAEAEIPETVINEVAPIEVQEAAKSA